ncbi:hypothetical protein MUCCIDRAFT_154817 [Mucor lusitanicus CBS 277.49]|uniref:RRM domain-containing protein n=2 Tax=Mucor circinelloides f. lusitanicus TaxID=29924 RepID=A0A168PP77_MUCCL|nr:hypothetical protein MUCCIDRAFT_154817 [Mucor lusitanicus CBS 277.49]
MALKTCQRASFHTTQHNNNTATEKKNFAENMSKQFIGHVKKQRSHQTKAFAEPSRFVVIDALPPTATTEDVYKLAREAFTDGDKQIIEAVFCRNHEFNFTGRCIVSLSTTEDARRLIEYGHRRVLGGNTLKINYTGNAKSDVSSVMSQHRRSEMTSLTDNTSASGRAVIVTGLPPRTQPEHLLGYLRSRNFFPVEGAPDNVLHLKTKEQSTVAKFLVKFDSESEAWRCVRTFHNTDFLLKSRQEKYRLQLSVAY